jgi:hypothetical protein
LDSSVNRSLGSQIGHRIRGLRIGTRVDKIIMQGRLRIRG